MHFATQAASPLTQVAGLDPLQLCRRLTRGQQGASRVLCCARPTEFQAGQPPPHTDGLPEGSLPAPNPGEGSPGLSAREPAASGRQEPGSGNAAGRGGAVLEKCCVTSYLGGRGSVPSTRHPVHAAANELTRNPPPGQWRGLCEAPGAGAWPGAGTPRWSGLRLVGQVGPAVAANQPLPAGFSRNR